MLEELASRFEDIQLIGTGSNADVFRAFDKNLNRTVTLKVAIKQLSQYRKFRMRWYHEVALLKQVSSPFIVSLLDTGQIDNRPYMVLDYAQERLEEALQKPRPIRVILSWMEQLLEAISACHFLGVVHQDINPDNILIQNDRLILTDFSAARFVSLLHTDPAQISGTLGWCAPEQQRRQHKSVGLKSDIYAWGRVFHSCIQGTEVFELFEDIIAKATALEVHKRFVHAGGIRTLLKQRLKQLSPVTLDRVYRVDLKIPVPLNTVPTKVHSTFSSEVFQQSPRGDLEQFIWQHAKLAHRFRKTELLLIESQDYSAMRVQLKHTLETLYSFGMPPSM